MTDTTSPPAPLPAAPKKRGPWLRLGIGCLSVIVLGCIGIGGFAFYENWQQERNYQAGHQAYLQADCAGAVDPLRKAASGEPGTRGNDVALKAQAELQECEALLAADAFADQNKPADAVLAYSALVTKYASSPLKEPALAKGQQLFAQGATDALATAALCESVDDLADQQFIAQPDTALPPLLYACGQAYEDDGAFSEAVAAYDRFRRAYPDHELAEDVQRAFVRATIAEADAVGAGTLPAPQVVGSSGAAGGPVTVVIQNDSPERLSMVFSGPEVRVEELDACTDCQKFIGDGPSACPEKGPVGRYELPPGTYDVVVKASSGRDVTPFRGSWALEDGQEYSSCFYLVTSQQ
jgi:tetratricopeptide (TPR) repeat protein